MGVISTSILIKIGSSITKSLLKVWLKDNEFAKNISVDIADMIEKKIDGVVLKRKTERFFERISEEIADEINRLLESNADDFKDEQKENIAQAVIDAFDNSTLNEDILFSKDLDPLKLSKYILKNKIDSSYNLKGKEIEKYESIILEGCNYIVEFIATFPSFNQKSTQEILNRESESIELIKQVIENLPNIREESGKKEDDKFETAYCRRVALKLDSIELFGVSLSQVKPRYNLSIAYINLYLSYFSDTDDTEYHFRSEEALSKSSLSIIRGEPGSGKTTLLQWIAVNAIRKQFTGKLRKWNNCIPFFIRLRNYSNGGFPTPSKFIDSIAKNISSYMPKGWVNRKIDSNRCVLLVDGFDELPPLIRDEAEEWLIELIEDFPNLTVIISSRPSAIEVEWLSDWGFEDLMLQPMSLNDISKFIDHWHEASNDIYTGKPSEIINYKQSIKRMIKDNSSLRNLASSPLLCAMLCVLNLDRNSQLPKDRMELYRISLETILDRRDIERRISTNVSLTRIEKEILLQDLAYWLLLNDYTDCVKYDVINRIEKVILSIPRLRNEKSNLIFQDLLERSGLLREPTIGRVNFIHKTFQEYLSAKKAIEENDIGILIQHVESDQWKEVIILAAGHANIKQVENLIFGLVKASNTSKNNEKRIKFIAIACMETATQLSARTVELLDKTSQLLFPPKNDEDSKDLAAAGEGVINYLSGYEKESDRIISSCIKALTWIGGTKSIKVISEYSYISNKTITNTLLWAWEYFDQELFAKEVLFNNNIRGPITLEEKETLNGLEYLTSLEILSLKYCDIDDYRSISYLKNLVDFKITNCSISDIKVISVLPNLSKLELISCWYLRNIDELSNCLNLKELAIYDCQKISSFKFIRNLTQLKHIHIPNSAITDLDIENLSYLKFLETINIDGCYKVSNISSLEKLKKLKRVQLPSMSLCDTLPYEMLKSIEIE